MNTKNMTVTSKNKMEFACPYCNAKFEVIEDTGCVITHAPDDPGFLPEERRNQTWWLISYSLGLLILGEILYKYVIGPLL